MTEPQIQQPDPATADFPASINPDVLVWARLNEGMTIAEAAKHFVVPDDWLRDVEQGRQEVSLRFLEEAARVYSRPLGIFFAAVPPKRNRQREERHVQFVSVHYSDGTEEIFQTPDE